MNIQAIWSLFRRPQPRPITRPIRYGFSIDDFRDEPGNVATLQSFLGSPIGLKFLGVLHHHRPRGYPVRGAATVEAAALEHMRREGHEGAVALIEAMASPEAKRKDEAIPITWGVDEDEDQGQEAR